MFFLITITCVVGVAAAAPYGSDAAVDTMDIPRYEFNYAVNDGHVVKGSYSLSEPDGTIILVYTPGFNAVVKRVVQAAHAHTHNEARKKKLGPVAQVVAPLTHVTQAVAALPDSLVGLGDLGMGLGSHTIGLANNALLLGAPALNLASNVVGIGASGLSLGGFDLSHGLSGIGFNTLGYGGWKHSIKRSNVVLANHV